MKRTLSSTGLRSTWSPLVLFGILAACTSLVHARSPNITVRSTAETVVDGVPGQTLSSGFVVQNMSASHLAVWTILETPRTWRVVVTDPPFTLDSGASDLRLITLAIPATAAEGEYQIRYIAAPAESPSDSVVAILRIRIPAVRSIALRHIDSPGKVVSGSTYTSSFVLTNEGNRPADIRLRAKGIDARFSIHLDATQMQLAPRESRTVGVKVETVRNGGDAYHYRVDLSATLESDSTVTAQASSTVQILPGLDAVEARYQNFPLLGTVRWGGGQDGSGPQFELSGSGALSNEGTDRLDLLVRTPDLQSRSILGYRDEYRLGYRTETLEAYAGDKNFVLSPLTEYGRYAFGASVAYRDRDVTVSALANRDRFLWTHPQEAGGSVGVHLTPGTETSVNYLYRQETGNSQIITARMRSSEIFRTEADVELGRDFGERADNAVSLSWRVRREWGSVAATYLHAGPGYQGYYTDVDFLSAGMTVYPLYPFRVDANYRDEKRNLDLDPARFSAPRARYYELGLGYERYLSIYYRSNQYADRLPNPLYDRSDNSVLIQAGYPGPRLGILGQFEAGTQKDDIQEYSYPFRRYALISSFSPSPAQSYGATLEFEQRRGLLSQPSMDRLSGSVRAALTLPGGTRALIHFYGSKTLSGFEQMYTYLDMALEHRFPFGHLIGIHVRQSTFTPSPVAQDLSFVAEYSVPFSLPLKFSTRSRTIRGQFMNSENGAPVSGAILMLDGAAVLTDPSGEFLFPDVQPGPHYLQFDQAGIGLEYVTVPLLPLEINVETESPEINISLVRSASVEGTVLIVPHADAENRTLVLSAAVENPGLNDLLIELTSGPRQQRQRTDSRGHFDFKGLPPGQWHLRVLGKDRLDTYRIDPDTVTFILQPGDHHEANFKATPRQREIKIIDQGKTLTDSTALDALPPRSSPPEIPRAESATALYLENSGNYTVLINSYSSRAEAERDASRFGEALGLPAHVRPVMVSATETSYQALLGSFSSEADADAIASLLRSTSP